MFCCFIVVSCQGYLLLLLFLLFVALSVVASLLFSVFYNCHCPACCIMFFLLFLVALLFLVLWFMFMLLFLFHVFCVPLDIILLHYSSFKFGLSSLSCHGTDYKNSESKKKKTRGGARRSPDNV